jgi:CubicO group peptidase (beta-lactamase class C family)
MFTKPLFLCISAVCLLMVVLGAFLTLPGAAKNLDSYLKDKGFEGAALIAKGGEILLKKGYGLANREHNVPNLPKTVFRIASLTKQITAIAILQLEQQGLLDLHDPISKFLPDYPEPQGNLITIHHLLSHTSGVAEITDFPNLAEIQRRPSTPKQVIAYFSALPLLFAPGTDCKYSNSGYIILGAVLESITGQVYSYYVKEHIFTPLGMDSSDMETSSLIIANKASGYVQEAHARYLDMSFPHASGALVSTVEDLHCLRLGLGSLLNQKNREALFTVHGVNPENSLAYGYGCRVGPQNKGMEGCPESIVGHFGGIEGFSAASVYYPDHDLTIILLSNVENMPVREFHKDLAHFILSSWRS